jgi:hypothetical protein
MLGVYAQAESEIKGRGWGGVIICSVVSIVGMCISKNNVRGITTSVHRI